MGGHSKQSNSATAISEINLQQSSSAAAIPIVYGTTRVAANIIDYGDFKAIAHTSTSSAGGKGGGSAPSETTYTYQAYILLGICEGPISSFGAVWVGKDRYASPSQLNFATFNGAEGQTPWGYLSSNHVGRAMGYSGTAYVAAAAYALDSQAGLANHNFEVSGRCVFGGGASILDANPAAIVPDFLTSSRYGAVFPATSIGDLTQYSNYCIAAGLFVSPVIDSSQAATQFLDDLMTITNTALVWSEGVIKLTPYGDKVITGYGVTFTPNVTPLYDLTDDDFLGDGQPVQLTRPSPADQYNAYQMEILDRANDYNKLVISTQDQANINRYGLRQASKVTANMICTPAIGRFALELYKQRRLYTLNQYQFTIGWKYALLEPMDIVTITDLAMGLNRAPVRILSIEENDALELTITAEEYPAGAGHAATYAATSAAGYVAQYNTPPGDIAQPEFVELPKSFSSTGLSLAVAATGTQANWGGCEVWVSTDNATYARLGVVRGGARYGTLTAPCANNAGVCSVHLVGLGGQILSASASDLSLWNSLCAIENEFIAYQGATLTSANTYALDSLRRGGYGSTAITHNAGATFIRMDDAVLRSDALDLSYIGTTLYFKFLSFNVYGGATQQLSDVSAYTYTISGAQALAPPPGPTNLAATVSSAGVQLTWTVPPQYGILGSLMTYIERAPQVGGVAGTFAPISNVTGLASYTDPIINGSVYYYRTRCRDQYGNYSAYSSTIVITATAGQTSAYVSGLSVSISPSSLSASQKASSITTVTATANVTGALSTVSYGWTYVSGSTSITINTPATATTTFSATGLSAGDSRSAVFRCTATDGINVGSATLTVTISYPASGSAGGGGGGVGGGGGGVIP